MGGMGASFLLKYVTCYLLPQFYPPTGPTGKLTPKRRH